MSVTNADGDAFIGDQFVCRSDIYVNGQANGCSYVFAFEPEPFLGSIFPFGEFGVFGARFDKSGPGPSLSAPSRNLHFQTIGQIEYSL